MVVRIMWYLIRNFGYKYNFFLKFKIKNCKILKLKNISCTIKIKYENFKNEKYQPNKQVFFRIT